MMKVLKILSNKGYRERLKEIATISGVITPHLLDHVMNESMMDNYISPNVKRANDKFFEMIGMKHFTDFTRIVATEFAVQDLKALALGKLPASMMAEVNVVPSELQAWANSGFKMDRATLDAFPSIKTAIAVWTDHAIIRPNAALRPPVGSDARFKLFWHLKGFLWAHYGVIMKNVFRQMGSQENFMIAMPMIAMAAYSMALTMLGYELRRFLSDEALPDLFGVDTVHRKSMTSGEYSTEIADRSGMLGPFAVANDMIKAEKRGQMALSAFMGPAFSKMVAFADKDIPSFLASSTPIAAQSPAIQRAAKVFYGEYLPKEIIPKD